MAHQLASCLAHDGHAVTVIGPFPNRPLGRVYEGYRRRLYKIEANGGSYRLVRCANWLVGERRRHINRLLENVTFGLSATWAAWHETRPDVILVETWPLFGVVFPALLARWWRIPFLYYVKDVYPEAAEKTGLIRGDGLVARFCRLWDRCLCLSSAKVIVISETMRDLMAGSRDISNGRFAVIPDWIDPADFLPQPIDNAWRHEQNLPKGTFVAMFGGTLGEVSGVEVLVEVARLLRDRPNVLILCVGE
jgi:glycosyltransferase involved in cell wall biosynthesis